VVAQELYVAKKYLIVVMEYVLLMKFQVMEKQTALKIVEVHAQIQMVEKTLI
jgi:hypothetical protein